MLAYLPWAMIPCAILFIVFYFFAKKENANLEELMTKVSEEAKYQIKKELYLPSKEGKNLYTTKGYVADITDNGSKAKAFIIFHNTPINEFYSQTAKLSSEELKEKGIEAGKFVPCIMKLDEEYQIYGFKKLA